MSDLSPAPQAGTGLAPNVAGALAYLLGPVTGVLFLVIEKRSRFVRFHAAQSIVVSIALIALGIGLGIVSVILDALPLLGLLIGLLLSLLLGLGSFLLWILLMYSAFQGREWEVPLIGHHARRLLAAPAE